MSSTNREALQRRRPHDNPVGGQQIAVARRIRRTSPPINRAALGGLHARRTDQAFHVHRMRLLVVRAVDHDVVRVVCDAWDVAVADAVFDLVHAPADKWATHTSLADGTAGFCGGTSPSTVTPTSLAVHWIAHLHTDGHELRRAHREPIDFDIDVCWRVIIYGVDGPHKLLEAMHLQQAHTAYFHHLADGVLDGRPERLCAAPNQDEHWCGAAYFVHVSSRPLRATLPYRRFAETCARAKKRRVLGRHGSVIVKPGRMCQ